MIVYMGSSNAVCDLSVAAGNLLEEGFSTEEVVWEVIEYCANNGVHVHAYDVEMMLNDQLIDGGDF